MKIRFLAGLIASIAAYAGSAQAQEAAYGKPVEWQIRMQEAATGIMSQIESFEVYTLWFIIPIVLLVLGLLAYVIFRFGEKSNPVPSRTSHNTTIEVIWTIGPVFILMLLAFPSFNLLTAQYSPPAADITIKATGYQWYWGYEYQTEGSEPVSFDSLLLQEGDRASYGKEDMGEYPRLLAVDNEVVVPIGKTVRVLVTGADVIHAFAMPSFGIKIDAMPGRLNETWFKAEREGIYYGQCSELCGKDHAFMPIAIRVVSEDKFQAWMADAATDVEGANKKLMASIEAGRKTVDVAANSAQ